MIAAAGLFVRFTISQWVWVQSSTGSYIYELLRIGNK